MRQGHALRLCLLSFVLAAAAALPAYAAAPVPVVFGSSWDGASNELQAIVDARYGAGLIDVRHDYIGAHVGDPDPWFWIDDHFSALLVKEVAGNANRNLLGWYIEPQTVAPPVIDGADDGVVFQGADGSGAIAFVTFPRMNSRFGFYMNPNGPLSATNAPEPELFFTNRFYNDKGPNGSGAVHAPYDGDVQAIVFDISAFTHPNMWLVCFEDLDSGPNPSPCCDGTDNDFNDLIFEVQALGATPTVPLSFGALKAKYR